VHQDGSNSKVLFPPLPLHNMHCKMAEHALEICIELGILEEEI
jgi:hypothetical protein